MREKTKAGGGTESEVTEKVKGYNTYIHLYALLLYLYINFIITSSSNDIVNPNIGIPTCMPIFEPVSNRNWRRVGSIVK